VDGVSVQDNYLKSTDGFFARMSPRLDAIEEVTVTTAGNGAEASAQGSIQIRFTTRSGATPHRQRLLLLPARRLNTNTYSEVRTSQERRPAPAGHPRAIVIPGFRRPRQGVLLRELRKLTPRRSRPLDFTPGPADLPV
jgi:hypothetical protein